MMEDNKIASKSGDLINLAEYQILEGLPKDIQMKLNQLRHQYAIHILTNSAFLSYDNETWCVMVVALQKLEPEK
jgi:hypothetical protein